MTEVRSYTLQLFHKPASHTIHRRILRTDPDGTRIFHGRNIDVHNGWKLFDQQKINAYTSLAWCEAWFQQKEDELLLGDTKHASVVTLGSRQ